MRKLILITASLLIATGIFAEQKPINSPLCKFEDTEAFTGDSFCNLNFDVLGCGEATYTGAFKDSFMHGQGTIKTKGGCVFVGEMENDHLKEGTYTSPSATYTGSFVNDWMYKGKLTMSNRTFEGEFVYGGVYKTGTLTELDTGLVYTGDFGYFPEENPKYQPHGQGSFYTPDGSGYSGKFHEGLPTGKGMCTSPREGAKPCEVINGKLHVFGAESKSGWDNFFPSLFAQLLGAGAVVIIKK